MAYHTNSSNSNPTTPDTLAGPCQALRATLQAPASQNRHTSHLTHSTSQSIMQDVCRPFSTVRKPGQRGIFQSNKTSFKTARHQRNIFRTVMHLSGQLGIFQASRAFFRTAWYFSGQWVFQATSTYFRSVGHILASGASFSVVGHCQTYQSDCHSRDLDSQTFQCSWTFPDQVLLVTQ